MLRLEVQVLKAATPVEIDDAFAAQTYRRPSHGLVGMCCRIRDLGMSRKCQEKRQAGKEPAGGPLRFLTRANSRKVPLARRSTHSAIVYAAVGERYGRER